MYLCFRYMLEYGRILQRQELDAFLAMSVSPLLQDVQTMQDLKVSARFDSWIWYHLLYTLKVWHRKNGGGESWQWQNRI